MCPIVIAGIGGTVSVVAANAWMNEPAGFTLNSAGKVVDVDPWAVIFNKAMPLQSLHMLIAAYLVGGFLVASVYAFGMLRGRRDRYHRIGFLIPFTVAAIAMPIQMLVGDELARWVYNNEPVKFAAIEMVPKTSTDVPETLFGHLNDEGEVEGGIPIPGLASILSDPADGTSTVIQGLDSFPKDERPTNSQVDVVHLAWDVMVGLGTLLFLLSLWYFAVVGVQAADAEEQALPLDRGGGRGAVGDHDRSGLGRHRSRSPTVDRAQLHEGGGRGHRQHRGLDHLPRRARALRRCRRDAGPGAAADEPAVPGG